MFAAMNGMEKRSVRVAILDLYEGAANQGMRCIRSILIEWAEQNDLLLYAKEYDVRLKNELPDTSYDIYISSGGPGDPLTTRYDDWDIAWCRWLDKMHRWNENPDNTVKKHIYNMYDKLEVKSRIQLVNFIYENRLQDLWKI